MAHAVDALSLIKKDANSGEAEYKQILASDAARAVHTYILQQITFKENWMNFGQLFSIELNHRRFGRE